MAHAAGHGIAVCGPWPRAVPWRGKRPGARRAARALPYVYSRLDRGAPSLSSHKATWPVKRPRGGGFGERSEEHTSELQSLMRISYAVFCLKKKTKKQKRIQRKADTERQHEQ